MARPANGPSIRRPRRPVPLGGAAVRVYGQATRHGAAWLVLLTAGTLAGTGASLALPAVLGRAVDATIAGTAGTRWVVLVAGLIAIRVGADLVDTLAGASYVAG